MSDKYEDLGLVEVRFIDYDYEHSEVVTLQQHIEVKQSYSSGCKYLKPDGSYYTDTENIERWMQEWKDKHPIYWVHKDEL